MDDIRYTIPRSRLFYENYLPGAVIAHRNGMFGMVVGTDSDAEAANEINRVMLRDVAQEHLEHWAALGGTIDDTLVAAVQEDRIAVRVPTAIYVRPFPLLLQCTKRECGIVELTYGPHRQVDKLHGRIQRGTKSRIPCRHCGAPLRQLRFVQVHRCGALDQITPPYAVRGHSRIRFQDGGTFFRSLWVDADTNQSLGEAFQPRCRTCETYYPNSSGTVTRGAVIRSGRGDVFYPRLAQYLSLTEATTKLVEAARRDSLGETLGEAVLTGLLDLQTQTDLRANLRELSGQENTGSNLRTLEETHANLLKQREQLQGKPGMEPTVKLIDDKLKELVQEMRRAAGLFSESREYLNDSTLLRHLGAHRRAVEAALFRGEFRLHTLQDAIEAGEALRRGLFEGVRDHLAQHYGVREIAHVADVSVILASLGFTREQTEPSNRPGEVPLRLNVHVDEHSERMRGRVPIYALNARTEALLIRLDPCRIFAWAVDNLHWSQGNPKDAADPRRAHACVLQACSTLAGTPSTLRGEGGAALDANSMALLGLMHTISHSLIRTAKRGSGYDDNSLMEYLFPADLSLLIYVTSRKNYTAGGLRSLFEHGLQSWFETASTQSISCIYDPLCSEEGGSCHGCVQVPLGCETFNHGISRAYLHGGNARVLDNTLIHIERGFWT